MLKQILEKVNNSPKNSNSVHGQPNTSHWFYTPHVIWIHLAARSKRHPTLPKLSSQGSSTSSSEVKDSILLRSVQTSGKIPLPFQETSPYDPPLKKKIIDPKVPLKRGYVKFPGGYLHVGPTPLLHGRLFSHEFVPQGWVRHVKTYSSKSKSFKLKKYDLNMCLYCISSYVEYFYMKNPSSFQQSQFFPSHLLYEKIFSSHTIQLYTFALFSCPGSIFVTIFRSEFLFKSDWNPGSRVVQPNLDE